MKETYIISPPTNPKNTLICPKIHRIKNPIQKQKNEIKRQKTENSKYEIV
jgi:hypothetical protein